MLRYEKIECRRAIYARNRPVVSFAKGALDRFDQKRDLGKEFDLNKYVIYISHIRVRDYI